MIFLKIYLNSWAGTRVWNLLFPSKSLILKSHCERFAHSCSFVNSDVSNCEQIALNFFLKERYQWFAHDLSESLSKDERIAQKNLLFVGFWQFFSNFSFFAQERIAPIALCSVALFKKATGAICSGHSLKKSNHERFAPVSLHKIATFFKHSKNVKKCNFVIFF